MVDATNNGLGEAVQKARAVDPTDTSITGLRYIWRDLQAYHKSHIDEFPEFPCWLLSCGIPEKSLKLIVEAVYSSENDYFNRRGLIVDYWGRMDPRKQRAEKWVFHLFFGNFHQALSREMKKDAKELHRRKRTNIESFYSIYSKIKEFRNERLRDGTQDRGKNDLKFNPRDFKSCRKYIQQSFPLSDNEDGPDNDLTATDNEPGRGSNPEGGSRFSRRLATRHIQCETSQPASQQASIHDSGQISTIESDSESNRETDSETDSDSGHFTEDENDGESCAGDILSNAGTEGDQIEVRRASEGPLGDLQGSEEGYLPPEPTPEVDEQADKGYEGHISLPTRLNTVQFTADQISQHAIYTSASLPTELSVDHALDEGSSRDQTPHETQNDNLNIDEDLQEDYRDIEALFEAWEELYRLLRKEEDVLKSECQEKLRLRDQARNEWHELQQRLSELSTIAFDDVSGAACHQMSKANEDFDNICNKRKAYDEGISTDMRKKAKATAEIRKIKKVLTKAHIAYKGEGITPTAGGSDGVEQTDLNTGM